MNLEQLPSGSWRVTVKINGRLGRATLPTKKEARRRGLELELQLGSKTPTRGNNATLDSLLKAHIAKQGFAATKIYDYNLIIAKIPDDVLEWVVTDVEPMMIEDLYDRLRDDGWTAHRLRTLHILLSSAWNRAKRYGWADRNIIAHTVDRPKVPKRRVVPPSTADVVKVLAEVDLGVEVFIRLAANVGARSGELVALQWPDLVGETLYIRRSLANIPGITEPVITDGSAGGKNHDRPISLDPQIVAVLKAWRHEQVNLAVASGCPSPLWMFSHDAGISPWRGDYISREFRRARDRAGVSGVSLKNLRHYMATTWLLDGEAPLVVAGRLGHGVNVTLDVYADFIAGADRAGALRQAGKLTG